MNLHFFKFAGIFLANFTSCLKSLFLFINLKLKYFLWNNVIITACYFSCALSLRQY